MVQLNYRRNNYDKIFYLENARKFFCEDVCNLMSEGNMKDACLTMSYLFLNKINVHLNMSGVLMLHKITR
jgi:hypothetical protein